MNFKNQFSKLLKLYENITNDYLGLIAAGVAFYLLLAAFPAMAALVSLYGLFSDPHFVAEQINLLERFLPPQSLEIFTEQATKLVSADQKALGFGFIVSLVIAIYSATKGIGALIQGMNIAFDEKETRNFFKLTVTEYTLTFIVLAYVLIALTLIAALPVILNMLFIPKTYLFLRWPLLFFTGIVGVQMLYSYGPSHARYKWQWMSIGAFAASILWVGISIGFSYFVQNFGSYNETYGSISAIIILLLWLWLSAIAILVGAEINNIYSKTTAYKRHPQEEPPEDLKSALH